MSDYTPRCTRCGCSVIDENNRCMNCGTNRSDGITQSELKRYDHIQMSLRTFIKLCDDGEIFELVESPNGMKILKAHKSDKYYVLEEGF